MNEIAAQIIKSKLAPPRIVSLPQRRTELCQSILERKDKRLTLVVGPAGCGKTTFAALLRKELVTNGCSVSWYNLSREDQDIGQFIAYLVAAFKPLERNIGETALNLYNHAGVSSMRSIMASLVNDLFELAVPVHLFLEDFHVVADSGIPSFLQQFIDMAPPTVRLIITSRVRPKIDYVQLRVQDELNELSFSDLRFSLQESIAFLRNQGLTMLGPSQMHRLHTLSDGWAAGLQLLAYSLKKSKDPSAYIDRLKGTLTPKKEASLTQYLNDVVIPMLTESELDFLVRTSACRRFNSELCTLVTGNADAGRLLEKFEADSLFVIPIDFEDDRQWYRFHKIFSKFLNDRLVLLAPEKLGEINRTASDWFAKQGLRAEAIRHAVYAGDVSSYVELIERSARGLIGTAQFIQLLKWFAQVPADAIQGRLELLLCVAWAQISCGKREEFDRNLHIIELMPDSSEPGVAFELVLLKAERFLRMDDTEAALLLLEPYLSNPPAAGRFSMHLLYLLSSQALVYSNEYTQARDVAMRSRRQVFYDAPHANIPLMDASIGLSYLLQGDVLQAKAVLFEAIKSTSGKSRNGSDSVAYVAAYLAEAHYQLNELKEADALIAEYGPLIDVIGFADSILFVRRVEVRLHLLRGDVEAALRVTKQTEKRGVELGLDRIICWSLQEQIRLQIRRRQLPAAHEALRRLEMIAGRYETRRRCAFGEIPLILTTARIDLMVEKKELQLALGLLLPLITEHEARGHILTVASLRTLQANLEFQVGDEVAAVGSLRSALTLATTFGLRRILLEGGDKTLEILSLILRGNFLSDDERKMAIACAAHLAVRPSAQTGNMISVPAQAQSSSELNGLSGKELEIVELLAQAFSNKSIARALNISSGTVKWHLKNIFAKLDVGSREGAVIKARNQRLID
jgi:LuxR family maltose regulon positive regulatory protein